MTEHHEENMGISDEGSECLDYEQNSLVESIAEIRSSKLINSAAKYK